MWTTQISTFWKMGYCLFSPHQKFILRWFNRALRTGKRDDNINHQLREVCNCLHFLDDPAVICMVVFMISLNFSKIFEKYCLDTLMFTFKCPYQTAPVYIKHDVQEKLTYVFHSLNSGIYLSLLLLTQAFNDCFKISVFSMFFFPHILTSQIKYGPFLMSVRQQVWYFRGWFLHQTLSRLFLSVPIVLISIVSVIQPWLRSPAAKCYIGVQNWQAGLRETVEQH